MNKKVIVQILRAPIGGIRKHVFDILFFMDQPNIQQIFITNTKDSDIDLSGLSKINNLELIHLEIKDQPSIKDFLNIFKVYNLLKDKKVTVIHGHGAKGGLYSRIVSTLINSKSFYTPHGGSLHRNYGIIKNFIYDLVEKVLVNFTSKFIFESQYSADAFRLNINKKANSLVNYNGVDVSNNTNPLSYKAGNKIFMSSFGLLRHLKGHDIAIKTCRLLKNENIPFEYVIYGEGESRSQLQGLIDELDLNQEVKLFGYTNNPLAEMQKYHLVFHPSRFESFGYVPVEAMSLKIPVICSYEGGLKEVVDDKTAFISKENTAESYFELIKDIYQNENTLITSRVDSAYIKVKEKFSKEKMLNNLYKEYLNA